MIRFADDAALINEFDEELDDLLNRMNCLLSTRANCKNTRDIETAIEKLHIIFDDQDMQVVKEGGKIIVYRPVDVEVITH